MNFFEFINAYKSATWADLAEDPHAPLPPVPVKTKPKRTICNAPLGIKKQ